MHVEWYGQSSFRLTANDTSVFIAHMPHVHKLDNPRFDTAELQTTNPLAIVPAAP